MKKIHSLSVLLFAAFSLINLQLHAEENKASSHQLRYPLKGIDRPSIMPTGIIAFDTKANIKNGMQSLTWDLNSQFGIVNKLEGQVGYDGINFGLGKDKPTEFTKAINLGLKYNYFSVNHVSLSASAKLPVHILDGEIITDVTFGLPTVFYNSMMAGGLLGDVFTLTMRDKIAAKFAFDWWYGAQVWGNLWAEVSSSFAKVEMTNKNNQAEWKTTPLWKELPVSLTALYAFNPYFDLSANFGFDDAFKAKETMKFGIGFGFRAGKLFG